MICTKCLREIADRSNFCNFCGGLQPLAPGAGRPRKRLFRSPVDRRIAGICGGIAEYLELDPTVVRLVCLVLIFIPMPIVPAVVAYLLAWLVVPQAPPLTPTSASSSCGVANGAPRSPQTV